MLKRILLSLGLSIMTIQSYADTLDALIDPDPEPENPGYPPDRRRSRPMMQWVTIDTDALTVTTTLTDPVITYYIMDESEEVMLIVADAPEQFAADVATLPAGDYTIRLLTATDRSFSGPLTIN